MRRRRLSPAADNLLGIEIVLEPGIAAALADPPAPPDLRGACHATGEEILAAGFGQFGSIILRVHRRSAPRAFLDRGSSLTKRHGPAPWC